VGGNDKVKRRILSGAEPFLAELGISDANGRVHDKKQAKFRQINRFLELIRDVESHLPAEGVLNIADLCCGKSYLSFAVYHYFAIIRGREVKMTGVDLKTDVIEYCSGVARELGFSGLEFLAGDVNLYNTEDKVNMVVSLHACDVATDIVLQTATALSAKAILSTPCCQKYLSERICNDSLSFVTEYGHLNRKLSDALTDALRALYLKKEGYRVQVCELTDPQDTPKNTLLRAVKVRKHCEDAQKQYDAALTFLLGDGAKDYLKEFE
jgi:SAM-dependent methyltransferase